MPPTQGHSRVTSHTYAWLIFIGLALFAFNALVFIHYTAAPQVRSDVWRHLHEIVIPFLEGRDSAAVLWTNHHPSPLLHLIQIANLKWFDLRLDLDAYLDFFSNFLPWASY